MLITPALGKLKQVVSKFETRMDWRARPWFSFVRGFCFQKWGRRTEKVEKNRAKSFQDFQDQMAGDA